MVRTSGDFILQKPSLAEALARAVPYILSDLGKVHIYRPRSGAPIKDRIIDASRISEPGANDILIEDGDTIFIPEKLI